MRSLDSVRPALPDPIPNQVAETTPFAIIDAKGPIQVSGHNRPSVVLFVRLLADSPIDGDGAMCCEGEIRALWLGAYDGNLQILKEFDGSDIPEPIGPCLLSWAPTKNGQRVRVLVPVDRDAEDAGGLTASEPAELADEPASLTTKRAR